MRRTRGASAAGKKFLPQMNADRPVSRVRVWLNARLSHRDISVHLRSSAAKIPFFLITQPQPNGTRHGPGPVRPYPAAKPGPTVPFKPFRTDPLNREPTARPGSTAPFKPFRTDPLNREPTAKPGSTVPFKPFRFKPSRTDPLNREPGIVPDPGLHRGRLLNPDQCIASMIPLIPANPRDAPHTRRRRRRQEILATDERR